MLNLKSYTLFTIFIVLILFCSTLLSQPNIKLNGYIQTTASLNEGNKAFVFGFERVRLGAKGSLNEYADYKLLVDFTDTNDEIGNDGDTPGIIKFAQLTFKTVADINFTVGKFKVPFGMEWNTAASKLDFVKRGLGQSFVFHFDTGAMIHKNNIGSMKMGIALGAFNAGPNKANDVGDPTKGADYTLASRLHCNPIDNIYTEVSFGSALTSVENQERINVLGLGLQYNLTSKLCCKAEYLSRSDKQNESSDGSSYYLQGGYLVTPTMEPIIKLENRDVTNDDADRQDITLGCNFFLNPKKHNESKIQLNYIISDTDGSSAFLALFQGAF